MVEACCALGLCLSAVGLFLYLMQMMAARVWLDHQLYQALICVAQGESRRLCEQTAARRSSFSLTRRVRFALGRDGGEWRGSYQWAGFAGAELAGSLQLGLSRDKRGLRP